jgi:magnesium transporter
VIPTEAEGDSSKEVEHVAFLCRENFLLTLHGDPVPILQRFAAAKDTDAWLSERSIAALVSAMLIAISQECTQRTLEVKTSIKALESRMEADPDTVEMAEILEVRSELRELDGVVSEQLPCAQALRATDKPFFKLGDAQDYMNCAVANLEAADKAVERLSERIIGLRVAYETNAGDKTNHRLAILTVLSAIFLPASFLVGFWGMNFNMPEMNLAYAYPAALGLLVLTGSSLFLYFRKNGWFD